MATMLFRSFCTWRAPVVRTGLLLKHNRCSTLTFSRLAHMATEKKTVQENSIDTESLDVQEEGKEEGLPFDVLKGKVSYDTLKAITVKPMKHTHMTPVQEAVLSLLPEIADPPKADDGGEGGPPRDLLVRAKTGTGKTLAFLVPAIEARLKALEAEGKRAVHDAGLEFDKNLQARAKRTMSKTKVGALILSPTRELATQIANEAQRLTHHHDEFEVQLLTGGVSKRAQMRAWTKGRLDIVVATTGRLRDLIESEPEVRDALKGTRMLILDEADTMLDMGFREDIDAIAEDLPPPPERQTFLFSATVTRSVEQISRRIMQKRHAFINTVSEDDSPVHAHVPQYHTVLPSASEQLPHVLRLLAHDQLTNPGHSKALVFLPTTKMTQLYASFFRELSSVVLPAGRQTKIYEIHSRKSMESRVSTNDQFRKDKSGACVLVTSDVSARGVDYPGISRVIQVGIPHSTEQYIHRVGRTGRKGSVTGRGDLVLLPWEVGFLTWQLHGVPMKPLTSNELKRQVTELAAKFDEDPDSFFKHIEPDLPKKRTDFKSRSTPVRFKGPVTPRLSGIEDEIREVLSALEEEAVKETMSSLLGYYVAKAPEMRVQKSAIVEGCKDWSVQACGLPRPPFISEAFLKKLGVNDSREKKSGQPKQFGFTRSRTDIQSSHWMGRGSVRRRMTDEEEPSQRRREDRADAYDSLAESGYRSRRSSNSFDRRSSRSSSRDREEDTSRIFRRKNRSQREDE